MYTNIFQNTTCSRAISTFKWHGKVLKKHAYCLAVFHPTKHWLCLTNSKLADGGKKKTNVAKYSLNIGDESVRVLNNMWPNKLLQLPTLAVARSYFYEPYMYFTNLHKEKIKKYVHFHYQNTLDTYLCRHLLKLNFKMIFFFKSCVWQKCLLYSMLEESYCFIHTVYSLQSFSKGNFLCMQGY